jgi:hypothetical protein
MSRDRTYVREIDWLEVFPWFGLVRAIVVAWGPSKLLLALLGMALTAAGWLAISRAFTYYRPVDPFIQRQAAAYQNSEPWKQSPPVTMNALAKGDAVERLSGTVAVVGDSLADLPSWYLTPFRQMFAWESNGAAFSMALLCALWVLAVWAFCGGAITRMAAVRLTQDRRLGVVQACRHAISKWLSYFSGPLFPLGGVALLVVLPAFFAGLIARWDPGFVVVGALWPIGLIFALVCAVLLMAALFGWPLMWSAVSTESSDAFDSFNRSFSYVTQRPFHLAFYALVALVIGALAWFVVALIGELTIYLMAWGVSWGSGVTRANEIHNATLGATDLSTGAQLVGFWSSLVRMLVLAFGHSFLWTAASGVYLLLRRDTDGTPLDEVFLDAAQDPFGLPPVKTDGAGVTVLDESHKPQPVA